MTDDEMAASVQAGLAGMISCETCTNMIPESEWVVIRNGPPYICTDCLLRRWRGWGEDEAYDD